MTEAGILLQKQNIPDMTRTLRIILTLCLLASARTGAAQSIVRKSFARAAQQIALMDSLAPADRFPASWEHDGTTRYTSAKGWISGFFPGNIWYLYEYTGDAKWLEAARRRTAQLETLRHYTQTHDVGFMVGCPCSLAYRLTRDDYYKQLMIDSSEALISRFDPTVGLIRSWNNKDGKANPFRVIIDNMMNLEMLFWASKHTGDPVYRDVAVRHADITMQNHFRDDASSFHVVSYNDDGTVESRGTFQGYSDSSAWARGQAWGLYGYTMCYRETGDAKYLKHAERIAGFIMHHPNTPADRIPYWDYDAPNIPDAPRDASAAAVISSALFELSTMVPEAEGRKYFDYAETLLMNLSSDAYLAGKGTNSGFILMHSVGHLPADSEIDTPLNYADYYYLEAIGRYLSLRGLDPRRI